MAIVRKSLGLLRYYAFSSKIYRSVDTETQNHPPYISVWGIFISLDGKYTAVPWMAASMLSTVALADDTTVPNVASVTPAGTSAPAF